MPLAVLTLTVLAFFLRFANLSPFKFYPDAYQNLIVARNIADYHSVVGYLGSEGMYYPYFLMWTRPIYPLVINFFQLSGLTAEKSAVLICLISSVLAVPAAYFLGRNLFNSKMSGFFAALLTAISFNLTVWSGFVYTEALAVFLNLLFLVSLSRKLDKPVKLAEWRDLLSGFLFSLIIFARYEYLLFLIPVILLVVAKSPTAKFKIFNILLGTICTSAIMLTQLYPWQDMLPAIFDQFSKLLKIASLFSAISAIFIFVLSRLNKSHKIRALNFVAKFSIVIITLITLITLIQLIFPETIIFDKTFSSMRKFFQFDFLLGIAFLIGIISLLNTEKNRVYGFFAISAIFLLWPIYNNINQEMQRYWTHLLPYLVIAATFGLTEIWLFVNSKVISQKSKGWYVTYGLIAVLVFSQLFVSYRGMKYWNDGNWFRPSYEQKSAQILNSFLSPSPPPPNHTGFLTVAPSPILLVSMPEPYYFHTNIPTQSIMDEYPYIFIDQSLDQRKLLIVYDMGMKDLFPNFSKIVESESGLKKILEYPVNEPYHFGTKTLQESEPVEVYETTVGELKQRIGELAN